LHEISVREITRQSLHGTAEITRQSSHVFNTPNFLADVFRIHFCSCMNIQHSHEVVSTTGENPLSIWKVSIKPLIFLDDKQLNSQFRYIKNCNIARGLGE